MQWISELVGMSTPEPEPEPEPEASVSSSSSFASKLLLAEQALERGRQQAASTAAAAIAAQPSTPPPAVDAPAAAPKRAIPDGREGGDAADVPSAASEPAAQPAPSTRICASERLGSQAEQDPLARRAEAVAHKLAGNTAYERGAYEAACAQYKAGLSALSAAAGSTSMGCGALVLVFPPRGGGAGAGTAAAVAAAEVSVVSAEGSGDEVSGGGGGGRRRRNGGLRLATVLCDDQASRTADVEYEGEGGVEEEEEEGVSLRRLLPVLGAADDEEGRALQLALHMNWARALLKRKRPAEGCARANVATALAEAGRARVAADNRARIAGTAPRPQPQSAVVKALYLRAQCCVAHKSWRKAEADLAQAMELEPTNKAVASLQRKLPALREKKRKEDRRLAKEVSRWLADNEEALDNGLRGM
jgi:hypothetical protein